MKSVPKLIRRFVGLLLLSFVLVAILNVVILAILVSNQAANGHPWSTAEEMAAALQVTEGGYALPDAAVQELQSNGAWAILIDNATHEVVWHSDDLPDSIPMRYTLSDIASLTRGYIDGYPTFTSGTEQGLMVLGYPKTSFWKHMWPSWDYQLIAKAPRIALLVLTANTVLLLLMYVIANSRVLRSLKPITNGIAALPTGEPVSIRETGLLSEVASHINSTSQVLQTQKRQLRKREAARANWIAGVSHDIRTPLSMVMGYADQLMAAPGLSDGDRKKAAIILKQSERIRNLVSDLNLASKLEYDMQPVHPKRENMIAIVRQVVADFINMDMDDKHPIAWETDEALTFCPVNADRDLMKRAIGNLIQNSINHNATGCRIYVKVTAQNGQCTITVADDGVGATDEQIEKLNKAPHYMVCDENVAEQRHGLGLLIVKQIAAAHGGTAEIAHSAYGGFCVKITLPIYP